MVRTCDWGWELKHTPLEAVRCTEAGYIFYRDPTGYGHWLCPTHRDAWVERAALKMQEVFGKEE